ncbi:MAG: FeoA family protein [Desulfovermiculus sp.]
MFQTRDAPGGWRSLLRRATCSGLSDSSPTVGPDVDERCLDQVRPGQTFCITRVSEGHGLCCKLYGMGLVPGVRLTVINNSGHGPVVISVQDSRIGLGRGMSRHIWGCVWSSYATRS